MIGCYALIFGFDESDYKEIPIDNFTNAIHYIIQALSIYDSYSLTHLELASYIRSKASEIANLTKDDTLDMTIVDYFYEILAYEPFLGFLKNDKNAVNLSFFVKLFSMFQRYYHIDIVSAKNRQFIVIKLFVDFMAILLEYGTEELEEDRQVDPDGKVQIMTIHQSKGLEFPIVVVGEIENITCKVDYGANELIPFYRRREPESLVLMSRDQPDKLLASIWKEGSKWSNAEIKKLDAIQIKPKLENEEKKYIHLLHI